MPFINIKLHYKLLYFTAAVQLMFSRDMEIVNLPEKSRKGKQFYLTAVGGAEYKIFLVLEVEADGCGLPIFLIRNLIITLQLKSLSRLDASYVIGSPVLFRNLLLNNFDFLEKSICRPLLG